jgi:hypothetical protein
LVPNLGRIGTNGQALEVIALAKRRRGYQDL